MIVELDVPPYVPADPFRLVALPAACLLATVLVVLVTTMPGAPAAAPPGPCGDSAEAVARGFFERMGSDAVRDCWAEGRIADAALARFAVATPPDEVRLGDVHLGREGAAMLAAYPVWADWWLELPPPPFPLDGSWRWLILRRDGARWAIVEVQAPR